MSKLNLSEAAAEILQQSKAKAGSESFGVGHKPSAKAPQQTAVEIGTAGHKTTDDNYDATKGVPTATPPGTKPPVGSEKFGDSPSKGSTSADFAAQPNAKDGRKDLAVSPEDGENTDKEKADRKKGPIAKQTFSANPGAKSPVAENSESDEEWEEEEEEELEEATVEEVMEDLESLEDSVFFEKYGCSKDQAKKAITSEEDEEDEEDKEETKQARKAKMKEDVDAMLSGENLSEEFKVKAATIFEAAVEARAEEIAVELEEKYIREFEETLETVKEDFATKLDSYLDYVVENWMTENELAIERGLRSEIVEDFIGALKNVFVEHYIDIPEEKVDIVEQLADRVEELEEQINDQILKNIDLKKSLSEQHKVEIIHTVCEGLSLSQVEKIKSLAKNVEFVSEEDFSEKLEAIKESYFPSGVVTASSDSLNDAVEIDEENTTKVVDPLIESYVSKISKLTKF